jgi:hypothetical protein
MGGIFYLAFFVREKVFYGVLLYFLLLGSMSWAYQRKISRTDLLLLEWSIAYFVVASLIAGSFPWYYVPLLPALARAMSKGIEEFARFIDLLMKGPVRPVDRLQAGIHQIILGSIICLLLVIQLSFWNKAWRQYRGVIADHRYAPYKRVADWLLRNATKEQTLATAEIGYLGFSTTMRIVDLSGLVTPGIHPWLGAGLDKTLEHALSIYSPDFVLVRKNTEESEIIAKNRNYTTEMAYKMIDMSCTGTNSLQP